MEIAWMTDRDFMHWRGTSVCHASDDRHIDLVPRSCDGGGNSSGWPNMLAGESRSTNGSYSTGVPLLSRADWLRAFPAMVLGRVPSTSVDDVVFGHTIDSFMLFCRGISGWTNSIQEYAYLVPLPGCAFLWMGLQPRAQVSRPICHHIPFYCAASYSIGAYVARVKSSALSGYAEIMNHIRMPRAILVREGRQLVSI